MPTSFASRWTGPRRWGRPSIGNQSRCKREIRSSGASSGARRRPPPVGVGSSDSPAARRRPEYRAGGVGSGSALTRDGATEIDRLYVVGRTARPTRSQAIISAGDGAAAALDILADIKGSDVQDWDTPPKS